MTLPELLALHLHTRRWERNQEADRLIDRAYHASKEGAEKLLEEARRLREPELPVFGEAHPLPDWMRKASGV